MHPSEAVGPTFNPQVLSNARDLGLELLHVCSLKVAQGMSEDQLHAIIKEEGLKRGMSKWWHPTKVRFGKNTRCSFKEPSAKGITIAPGDLFFLDIGPVFDNHEIDLGRTFRLGHQDFKNPAEDVFNLCQKAWQENKSTGLELYDLAKQYALDLGLTLNPQMAGHRLGDFPHALHHRGPLGAHDKTPLKDRWILEIHLLDDEGGYFFEDLL